MWYFNIVNFYFIKDITKQNDDHVLKVKSTKMPMHLCLEL